MGFFNLSTKSIYQDNFLKKVRNMPNFIVRQEFWSFNDKPFNGVLVDDINRKIALLSHLDNLGFMGTLEFFGDTMKRLKQEQPNLSDNELTNLTKKIVDRRNQESEYFIKICNYNDILRSEVVEDGNSITYTKRINQVASTAIGYALMGGAGAIIGGLSSKKKNVNTATNVSLHIFVKDTQNPLFRIEFLNKEKKKDSTDYKNAIDSANRLHALISVLIKQADEEAENEKNHAFTTKMPIADELKKLSGLFTQGILNKDEYETLKAKVIAKA